MITRMTHCSVYVLDQEEAKAFYTQTLGFSLGEDAEFDGFRWLTVSPPEQPDLEIVLMPISAGGFVDEDAAELARQAVAKGAFGGGILQTENCQATYDTYSQRGVEFLLPPTDRPWGIEAFFRDNSGNWFSMVQPSS
jgi:catechol 2,3-dioxygenase-like lactoylglutathione lyase family enzyme